MTIVKQQSKAKPKPAQQVERLWFVPTIIPPPKWPRHFGDTEFEDKTADKIFKALKGDQAYVFHHENLSATEGPSVWVFSARWKNNGRIYRNIQDVSKVIDDVSSQDESRLEHECLTNDVFFICGHGNRDERCGDRGRRVLSAFKNKGCRAFACSHLGGHAFAGNVLQLPRAAWYSFVEDSNVDEILHNSFSSVYYRGSSW